MMRTNLHIVAVTLILVFMLVTVVGCGEDDEPTGPSNDSTGIVLTTTTVSTVTRTSAQCGGTITSDGGDAITARGVCWSTDATPTIANSKTVDGAGTGSYASSITGLTEGTTYYVRAYATNSVGTGYGAVQSFTTTGSFGTVTDIDGNMYRTVTIGTQTWMVENLKVTHYRNGEWISHVADDAAWQGLTSGAYCEYNNNGANVFTYGRLYNWYAVDDSRGIAPAGWHVPSDAEWKQMEMYLGMSQWDADATSWRGGYVGGMLKETGTTYWTSPNADATNESGFSALPGGYRSWYGSFNYMGELAYFWSSTADSSGDAYVWNRMLSYKSSGVCRSELNPKSCGNSVRCVRD